MILFPSFSLSLSLSLSPPLSLLLSPRWRYSVQRILYNRRTVMASIVRWQRRLVGSCLGAWNAFMGRRALCRRIMGKLVARHQMQNKARGYIVWSHYMGRLRDAAHATAADRRNTVLGQCFSRMNRAKHMNSRAFDGWVFAVRVWKRNRHRVSVGVARWCRRTLYACVNAWSSFVERRARCRSIMGKLVTRHLAKIRSHVYLRLWHHATTQRDDHHDERRRDIVIQRFVNRMRFTTHTYAFRGWCEAVRTLKRNRNRVKTAVARMHHVTCGRSFDG